MLVYPVVQGGAPPRSKLVISPFTIDISPTKTIVKLELCSPTERYRGRGHHPQ